MTLEHGQGRVTESTQQQCEERGRDTVIGCNHGQQPLASQSESGQRWEQAPAEDQDSEPRRHWDNQAKGAWASLVLGAKFSLPMGLPSGDSVEFRGCCVCCEFVRVTE